MTMLAASSALVALFAMNDSRAQADSSSDLIKQLQGLKTSDADNQAAARAIKSLSGASDVSLLQALAAMKNATPIGRNWLMGLAGTLYRKAGANQTAELKNFLADTTQDAEARYLVFQWLSTGNDAMRKDLLSKMTQDPSPELRFAAIEDALKSPPESGKLAELLDAARHPEQVVSIIEKLKEKGTTIDQAKQFGFLMNWKLIGPFDNVGTVNFDKVFPVETDWIAGTVKSEYPGKSGSVKWKEETTSSPEGAVDLAEIFSNEKGCIVYAATEFESDRDTTAEVRLGCINGNKVWVNGKLVLSNEVYHTNMQIDQYNETIQLKKGKNQILVKISQNEQKEQWAQRFAFQLRISDSTGKAILAKGR
jgi:hypothetical protein